MNHSVTDQDHRQLVAIANRVFEVLAEETDLAVVGQELSRLVEHTKRHFELEKLLMTDSGYPDFLSHLRDHQALMAQLEALETIIAEGTLEIGPEAMLFLHDWLIDHIMHADRALADFLRDLPAQSNAVIEAKR